MEPPGGAMNRQTMSRLDAQSSVSGWPQVDEEAILREQETPIPQKPMSALGGDDSSEKQHEPETVSKGECPRLQAESR